jgi:hypothetical protein
MTKKHEKLTKAVKAKAVKKSQPKKIKSPKAAKVKSVTKKSQPKKSQPKKMKSPKAAKVKSITKKSQPSKLPSKPKSIKVEKVKMDKEFKCPSTISYDKVSVIDGKIVKQKDDKPSLPEIARLASLKSNFWSKDPFICEAGIRSDEGYIQSVENNFLRKEILNEINQLDSTWLEKNGVSSEEMKFENIIILAQYLVSVKFPHLSQKLKLKSVSDVKQFLLKPFTEEDRLLKEQFDLKAQEEDALRKQRLQMIYERAAKRRAERAKL